MAATPPGRTGAGNFVDAKGCKEWLNGLPITSIPQAQQQVLEGIRAMNRAEFDPLERLKCLELMREKIAFLQGEQRSRFFGKTLPLSSIDQTAWTTGRALLEEMESGYRQCLAAAQAGGPLASHAALVAQRLVRCLGAQMLFHAMVYRRFEDGLWLRLHAEFAAAESAGRAGERVKDTLESEDGASTVAEAYLNAVLLQAANLAEMTAPQIDFLEALLRRWVNKVRVLPQGAGGEAAAAIAMAVDLAEPAGMRPMPATGGPASQRTLDVEQLSRSIRRRVKALQAGEDVAGLGLPDEVASIDALAQLQRLHKCWCEIAPKAAVRIPAEREAGVAFGLPDIHFYVSGYEPFEQPDRPREMTRQEKDDIAVFGKVSERSMKLRLAELNITLETWGVIDESVGTWRLLRPSTASRGVAIGRIVGIRVGSGTPFYLGTVRALVQETDGRIEITVALFPGKPEPIAVRAVDRSRQTTAWTQALRLPPLERLGIPESLVVPTGIAPRGRGIDQWIGGPKEFTVREVLERGADYDRIAIA